MNDLCKSMFIVALAGVAFASPATAADRNAAIRGALRGPETNGNISYSFSYNMVDGLTDTWQSTSPPARPAAGKRGGATPRTLYDLGLASQDLPDQSVAQRYFERAVALYAKQWRRSHSQAALAGYASALMYADRTAAAATLLRAALRRNPQQWMGWASLGQALLVLSSYDLLADKKGHVPPNLSLKGNNWSETQKRIRRLKLSKTVVARAQAELDEGMADLHYAEVIAPDVPWPHFLRGDAESSNRPWLTAAIKVAKGETPPAASALLDLAADNVEVQKAADLRPRDYRLQMMAATTEFLTARLQSPSQNWADAPAGAHELMKRLIGRLWQISASRDPFTAARSLDSLNVIRLMTRPNDMDPIAGAQTALIRDPEDNIAVMLVVYGLSAYAKRYADDLKFCTQRIKIHPTALLWFARGISNAHLGNTAAAENDERSALKLDPTDFNANITLATLLLKDHTDAVSIAKARKLLYTAHQAGVKAPSDDNRLGYMLVNGAYLAITGHAGAARAQLEPVSANKTSSDDAETAKALLTAIGP